MDVGVLAGQGWRGIYIWLTALRIRSSLILSESLGQQGDPTDFLLKEISPEYPEYSLEGLKLKLKLQYFGHLIRRSD